MEDKPSILAVDKNRRNLELLAQFLGKEGFQVESASSIEEFAQTLTRAEAIELALVDISGFDRSIWDCCQQLREREIPFLVLSPRQSAAIQQESFAQGARSMLVKPLVVKELLGIIRSLVSHKE